MAISSESPYIDLFLQVENSSFSATTVLVKINLPPATTEDGIFYICTKDAATDMTKVFTHQGIETVTQVSLDYMKKKCN